MKRQSGFNLVELAIVLVIIGLLVGGVLKGQALVTSAKVKRINNDFNGITAAVYTYLDRYSALPGDDGAACTRWDDGTTCANVPKGDGDGALEGGWNSSTATDESVLLWLHLYQSNLVATQKQPANPFGGIMGVQEPTVTVSGTATTYLIPNMAATPVNVDIKMSGIVVCMDNLNGEIASIVDANFDDGIPESGLVRGFLETGTALATTTYSYDSQYVICKRI